MAALLGAVLAIVPAQANGKGPGLSRAHLRRDMPAQGALPVVGRDYAPVLIDAIRHAEKNVDLLLYQARCYSDYPDSASNAVILALLDAMERGVSVRVVLDLSDWKEQTGQEENDKNREFGRILAFAGAQVFADPAAIVSHEKVAIVDGKLSLVSTHNLSYYSTDKNQEAAVLLWGEEVADALSAYFHARMTEGVALTEKSPMPYPQPKPAEAAVTGTAATSPTAQAEPTPVPTPVFANEAEAHAKARDAYRAIINQPGGAPPVEPGSAGPMDAWVNSMAWLPVERVDLAANREYFHRVGDLIGSAQRSVVVAQNTVEFSNQTPPYADKNRPKTLPPSVVNVLIGDLIWAANRGVKVTVLADWSSQRDNGRNRPGLEALTQAGVEVINDDPETTLHAKMLIVDETTTVIGSTNWTFNAIEQGNEVSVIVESIPLAVAYKRAFDEWAAKGKPAKGGAGNGAIPPMTESYSN